MSKKKLPKIITEVGFDFNWDNKKVWNLQIPIEEINLSKLSWHFKIPFWDTKNGRYNLKPIDVINFQKNNREEYERTMKADLSHPIDIMKNKGRWLIIDGLHRSVKAKILGNSKIQVRKIPRSKIPEITKQIPDTT